jgi:type IV pilus assembly protein PilY1
MVKGNYRMWATIESKVCAWRNGESVNLSQVKLGAKLARYYGNALPFFGGGSIRHESSLPVNGTDSATYSSSGTIGPEINVRVKVCDPNFLGDERCQKFPQGSPVTSNIYKPFGLLQDFGFIGPGQTTAKAEFGLISGSYDQNLIAGALRKNMGDFSSEIDATTGRFCHTASSQALTGTSGACAAAGSGRGAIAALDRIVLYGRNGSYTGGAVAQASSLGTLPAGTLPAWGNPIGEMVVQALNYYAGNTSTNPATTTNDTNKGIPVSTWTNPLTYTNTTTIANYGKAACRSLNVLALTSSALSFDQNADTPFASLPNRVEGSLASYVNRMGRAEGINSSARSVGSVAGGFGQNCSAKSVVNLSDVSGICPEAPAVGGSFQVAGAALYANTSRIQNLTLPIDAPYSALKVQTMAATLGGGVARIEVPIPNTNPKKFVYITPEGLWANGPAAMLTFSSISSSSTHGAFLVTWNDALFGGDHDMDLTGYLRYDIIAPATAGGDYRIRITSDIVNAGSGAGGGTHGYSVVGVNNSSASASSLAAVDSADGVYITHGHSRASTAVSSVVSTAGSMCADTNYRATGQPAGTYTVAAFPNHVATRAQVGGTGTVYNACWNSIDNWTLRDLNLPTAGTFVMRGSGNVLLNDPLWYAAKYGSFDARKAPAFTTTVATTTTVASTSTLPTAAWDARRADGASCGGTTGVSCNDGIPDGYFLARRPDLLEQQLRDQLEQIVAASNAAPAVSSSQLIDGSFKYVAQFDSTLKKGSVLAYQIDGTGLFNAAPSWDAGDLLKQLPVATRQVITNNSAQAGVSFLWSSLDATYTTAIKGTSSSSLDARGSGLVDYMRGSTSNEDPNGLKFQARSVSNLMGTIVNSTPWIQDTPGGFYTDSMFPVGTPSFRSYVVGNVSRDKILWVGANDGMLHGFKADTGAPVISYVPGILASNLAALTAPTSGVTVAGMDGSPFSGDVLTTIPTTGSATWSTYLFSSLGRGGKGIFALDVTNPTTLVQSNASNIFKWQFTSANDNDLGFVVGDPSINRFSGQASAIVRLNNGKTGILAPNGIDSANGKAALFILDVNGPSSTKVWTTGTHYYKLDTLATDSGNGMMGANWMDIDGNGTADWVYTTDLKGNIWKFDLTSSDPADWGSARKVLGVNTPIYTALSSAGTPLPITTTPAFGFPDRGGVVVAFGTGKALAGSGDFPNAGVTNRMFGIYDRTGTTTTFAWPTGTSNLVQRTLTEISAVSGSVTGTITPTLNLSIQDGWYFDFPSSSEMLLSSPDARAQFMGFTTVRSANTGVDQCFYTPPGRLWAIDPVTGAPGATNLGRFVDSTTGVEGSYFGVGIADQKVTFSNNRTSAVSSSTVPVTTATGGTTGTNILGISSGYRIQWREIPGLSTWGK